VEASRAQSDPSPDAERVVLAVRARADAVDAAPAASPPPSAPPEAGAGGGGTGGKKVFSLDEFLVEGKLEKPSAYYILRRSSLDHDWARLDARFLPLVLESVQDPLF
jgi:hypothetical protein